VAVSTYCHLLWDSVYIDQHGNVFACCHDQPGVLGNITKTDLATIWAGVDLAGYRRQSQTGRLACAPRCNILTPEQKATAGQHSAADYPKSVWLLWGELCNISCTMCPQDHRSRLMLDAEVLMRQIDWSRIEHVELQGCEVLAMKSAKVFYQWLTETAGAKVNLITNGLLVDEPWAYRLVRHGDWVMVSVNAATKGVHEAVNSGSRFERVIEGLRRLVAAKRARGAGAEVIFKFTIVPANAHEIPQAIRLANDIGCDLIAFGYDREVPPFLKADPELTRRLRLELADVAAELLPIRINDVRLRHLGLMAQPRASLVRRVHNVGASVRSGLARLSSRG
jgi:hypothetical protein